MIGLEGFAMRDDMKAWVRTNLTLELEQIVAKQAEELATLRKLIDDQEVIGYTYDGFYQNCGEPGERWHNCISEFKPIINKSIRNLRALTYRA